MIGLVPIPDFWGRLSAVGRQGKENRTPAYGAMQDPLFTEKGVTPDDHYEKLAPGLWGIVHGTIRTMWAIAGFIWASPLDSSPGTAVSF